MGKSLPRLRAVANTWCAFVQMKKKKKKTSSYKKMFLLAEQGTQLSEQNASRVSGPRLTHCAHQCTRHKTHNHVWRTQRGISFFTKDQSARICNQLSKIFTSHSLHSQPENKKVYHYRIVSAPPKQYSLGTPFLKPFFSPCKLYCPPFLSDICCSKWQGRSLPAGRGL